MFSNDASEDFKTGIQNSSVFSSHNKKNLRLDEIHSSTKSFNAASESSEINKLHDKPVSIFFTMLHLIKPPGWSPENKEHLAATVRGNFLKENPDLGATSRNFLSDKIWKRKPSFQDEEVINSLQIKNSVE